MLCACGRIGFDERSDAGPAACVTQLAVGRGHACALLDDGAVWCWGDNRMGQLGNGMISSTPGAPARVLEGPYLQLGAGLAHNCALRALDRGVDCWGDGGNDQLGPLTGQNSAVPFDVPGLTADELSVGGSHNCVREGTTVRCWGDADAGQLGDGVLVDSRGTPQPILQPGVTLLGEGQDHACVGTDTDTVWCWGVNGAGQLGAPATATTDTCMDLTDNLLPCSLQPISPAVLAIVTPVQQLAIGRRHTCARHDGRVFCWGEGESDQLGNGVSASTPTPTEIATKTTSAIAVVAGAAFGCVTEAGGKVWFWGEGTAGQIGDGALTDRTVPTEVPALVGASLVTTGPSTNSLCAVRGEDVVCWGDNTTGIVPTSSDVAVGTPTVALPRCP
jgi:alpha-tubulin suppressor-like RCC1 family protein